MSSGASTFGFGYAGGHSPVPVAVPVLAAVDRMPEAHMALAAIGASMESRTASRASSGGGGA